MHLIHFKQVVYVPYMYINRLIFLFIMPEFRYLTYMLIQILRSVCKKAARINDFLIGLVNI